MLDLFFYLGHRNHCGMLGARGALISCRLSTGPPPIRDAEWPYNAWRRTWWGSTRFPRMIRSVGGS